MENRKSTSSPPRKDAVVIAADVVGDGQGSSGPVDSRGKSAVGVDVADLSNYLSPFDEGYWSGDSAAVSTVRDVGIASLEKPQETSKSQEANILVAASEASGSKKRSYNPDLYGPVFYESGDDIEVSNL